MESSIDQKLENLKKSMLREIIANSHKGHLEDFRNPQLILAELSYHQAKMLLAVRANEPQAIKEYIADCCNFLFQLGNLYGVYDEDFEDKKDTEAYEIDKAIKIFKKVSKPSTNQNLFDKADNGNTK